MQSAECGVVSSWHGEDVTCKPCLWSKIHRCMRVSDSALHLLWSLSARVHALLVPLTRCRRADGTFTLNKFECSNQADVA